MPLMNVFDIAGSGMNAQSLRLNTTASNMANADAASSSINQTYRSRQPVFQAVMEDAAGQYRGVGRSTDPNAIAKVRVLGVVESKAPVRSIHDPSHPLADAKGFVHYPNVNAVEEMANMISASRSYQSNVEVFNASKQMMLRTLTLGQ